MKSAIKFKFDKKELGLVLSISAITLLLTHLIIIIAIIKAPPGQSFQVLFLDDEYSYFAFIEQARQGSFLFKNLYTSMPNAQVLFFPIFLVLGFIERLTNLTHPQTYALARAILGFIMLTASYGFISYFITNVKTRLLTFAFLCFSSGIGWLNILSQPLFPDYVNMFSVLYRTTAIPEALTFTLLISHPHFIAAVISMMIAFLFLLRSFEAENQKRALYLAFGGSFFSALAFINHPYDLAILITVPLAYCFVRRNKKVTTLTLIHFIFPLLTGLVGIFILRQNSVFSYFAGELQLSPPVWYWLILYGLILPLSVGGGIVILKNRAKGTYKEYHRWLFLIVWVIVTCFLLYSPISFQRRFIEGAHIPLSLLAGIFIYTVSAKFQNRLYRYILSGAILLILSWQNIAYITDLYNQLLVKNTAGVYQKYSVLSALEWAKSNVPKNSIAFSTPQFAVIIPSYTGLPVVFGHYGNTPYYYALVNEARQEFFSLASEDSRRCRYLHKYAIEYYFENTAISDKEELYIADKLSCLHKIYSDESVSIYTVNLSSL